MSAKHVYPGTGFRGGAEKRPFTAARGMPRSASPAERSSEGRSEIDQHSRHGTAGRPKEQCTQRHGDWKVVKTVGR